MNSSLPVTTLTRNSRGLLTDSPHLSFHPYGGGLRRWLVVDQDLSGVGEGPRRAALQTSGEDVEITSLKARGWLISAIPL